MDAPRQVGLASSQSEEATSVAYSVVPTGLPDAKHPSCRRPSWSQR